MDVCNAPQSFNCPLHLHPHQVSSTPQASTAATHRPSLAGDAGQEPTCTVLPAPSKSNLELGFQNKEMMRRLWCTHKSSVTTLSCTLTITHLLLTCLCRKHKQTNVFLADMSPHRLCHDSPATIIRWDSVSPWNSLSFLSLPQRLKLPWHVGYYSTSLCTNAKERIMIVRGAGCLEMWSRDLFSGHKVKCLPCKHQQQKSLLSGRRKEKTCKYWQSEYYKSLML